MDLDTADEIDDEAFNELDLSGRTLRGKSFEGCVFLRCKLSGATLSGCRFFDCTFDQCDLSSLSVPDSSFRDTRFRDCKLMGIDWTQARAEMGFVVRCDGCLMDFSRFTAMNLSGVELTSCRGERWELDETTLRNISVQDVDFGGSTIRRADLRNADLSSASNLHIDLLSCQLGKTKLALATAHGALAQLGVLVE